MRALCGSAPLAQGFLVGEQPLAFAGQGTGQRDGAALPAEELLLVALAVPGKEAVDRAGRVAAARGVMRKDRRQIEVPGRVIMSSLANDLDRDALKLRSSWAMAPMIAPCRGTMRWSER